MEGITMNHVPRRHRPAGIGLAMLILSSIATAAADIDVGRAAATVAEGALVVDVRSADEVAETSLLADATHVPHSDTDALIEAIGPDPDRPVVLYCSSGFRSAMAISDLQAAGYTNLVNGGGYDDLAAALEES
jgi:phage shock protein E